MAISRRTFLYVSPFTLAPLLVRCAGDDDPISEGSPFLHGVASGDPLPDAVILWTRVSPENIGVESVNVAWSVARDLLFEQIVAQGQVMTDESVDFTVKVDVTALDPGAVYFYRFSALGHESPVGRTRTARDVAVDRLRFALASCSNYPYGFFNAYAAIARHADLDAVIHLGDYLYEYAEGDYGLGAPLGRAPSPASEALTLSDYRARHAQYKTDRDLQEAHRQHPFIAIWDDHEVANDAFRDGAENHQPGEGDYQERKRAALRAYFEWMPVRIERLEGEERVYRGFRFGDLADLILLDTRHTGRDQQIADPCDANGLGAPERQLLGVEQERWLIEQLESSRDRGARWRLIGQQVLVSQVINVLLPGNCAFSTDSWDGYAAARQRVLSSLAEGAIDNVVVLTGDIHSSWGNDISPNPFDPALYDRATGSGSLAVEIVTPAVTSPGIDDPALAAELAGALTSTHPHVKYVNLFERGYVLLDITAERVQAEWWHMASISERLSDEALAAVLQVRDGENHLVVAGEASTPRADAAMLAPAGGV